MKQTALRLGWPGSPSAPLRRRKRQAAQPADRLRDLGVGLRVLNFGGDAVDTCTPIGSMLFIIMAALAQMELDIQRERINDSVSKRRAAGLDLGGRREKFTLS